MIAISQTMFSKFHLTFFLMVQLTIAIIWTNAHPIHWRIYAALGEGEFKVVAEWYSIIQN